MMKKSRKIPGDRRMQKPYKKNEKEKNQAKTRNRCCARFIQQQISYIFGNFVFVCFLAVTELVIEGEIS